MSLPWGETAQISHMDGVSSPAVSTPIYIHIHHLQEIALAAKSNTPLTAF